MRKKTMQKDLGWESRVKKECLVNVGFAEKMLFSWILKKAVGRPGLKKTV